MASALGPMKGDARACRRGRRTRGSRPTNPQPGHTASAPVSSRARSSTAMSTYGPRRGGAEVVGDGRTRATNIAVASPVVCRAIVWTVLAPGGVEGSRTACSSRMADSPRLTIAMRRNDTTFPSLLDAQNARQVSHWLHGVTGRGLRASHIADSGVAFVSGAGLSPASRLVARGLRYEAAGVLPVPPIQRGEYVRGPARWSRQETLRFLAASASGPPPGSRSATS